MTSISSNLTSLPEVIGLKEAQFDPFDETKITDLIEPFQWVYSSSALTLYPYFLAFKFYTIFCDFDGCLVENSSKFAKKPW